MMISDPGREKKNNNNNNNNNTPKVGVGVNCLTENGKVKRSLGRQASKAKKGRVGYQGAVGILPRGCNLCHATQLVTNGSEEGGGP